jgi:hypothetical protein
MNNILRAEAQATAPAAATIPRTYTRRGQVASYGDDRVCATPGCPTHLSRYNKASLCCVHDRPRDD